MSRQMPVARTLVCLALSLSIAACGEVVLPMPDLATDLGQARDVPVGVDRGGISTDTNLPSSDTGQPPADGTEPADEGTGPGEDAPTCTPQCGDRECGLDPVCGQSCGTCDDGLDCTTGACDPDGVCEHELQDGHCLINGECHGEGDASPDNGCLVCETGQAQDAWSTAGDGHACSAGSCSDLTWNGPMICESGACTGQVPNRDCNDWIDCTDDSCDPDQGCFNTLKDGYCLVYRTCLAPGQSNPVDPCSTCVVGAEPSDWPTVCEKDFATGLTWQEPAAELLNLTYAEAVNYCANLQIAGGGWRIPRIAELRSIIRGCAATVTGGTCGVNAGCRSTSCLDASCLGCTKDQGPSNGCYSMFPKRVTACGRFWSDTNVTDFPDNAWVVYLDTGRVDSVVKTNAALVRCVR